MALVAAAGATQTPPCLRSAPPLLGGQSRSASCAGLHGQGGLDITNIAVGTTAAFTAGIALRSRGRRLRRRPCSALALATSLAPAAHIARRSLAVLPRIWLAKDIRKEIKKDKHPWLYDRALRRTPSQPVSPGAVVAVAWKKETLALGFYDPDSVLRVRLLSWDLGVLPNSSWVSDVVADAAARRLQHKHLSECSGLRLLHGESDWTPGIVMDVYAGVGVVGFDGRAAEAFWRPHLPTVAKTFVAAGLRLDSMVKKGSGGALLWGEAVQEGPVIMEEHGAKFEVDVRYGHKTGFFLDQRENRRALRDLAKDKDVLDLFAYTGGFAVSAALGGARSVTAVDQATLAIEAACRNFALNGYEAVVEAMDRSSSSHSSGEDGSQASQPRHRLVIGDCWEFLEDAARLGQLYDVVVCDPPSMAPNARSRTRALGAYERLNTSSLQAVRPGGLLITCSCSSHITKSDLHDVVQAAGRRVGRELRVESETRAAVDHPVRRGFAEGDYLQALYVRVLT